MATAERRLAPWLFGGGFTAVAVLVTLLSVSTLTSSLSAALLMQLFWGGEMPPEAVAAAICIAIGAVFVGVGLLYLFVFTA